MRVLRKCLVPLQHLEKNMCRLPTLCQRGVAALSTACRTLELRTRFLFAKVSSWPLSHPHRIHVLYAIYGNIYHQYTPNVSIYTSTMDPMGSERHLQIPRNHGNHGLSIVNSKNGRSWEVCLVLVIQFDVCSKYSFWLVKHCLFSIIYGIILPID